MDTEKITKLEEQLAFCEQVINSTDEQITLNHVKPGHDIPPSSIRSSMKKERSRLKGKLAVLKGEKPKPGTKIMKIKVRTWNRPGQANMEIEAPYDDPDRCEQDCNALTRFAMSLFKTRHLPDSEREAARAEWLQKFDTNYVAAIAESIA